jgi:hypothetical protein
MELAGFEPMALASQAFKDWDSGKRLQGSATQRMAAAIIVHADTVRTGQGSNSVGSLASALTSKDTRAIYMKAMIEKFLPKPSERPTVVTADYTNELDAIAQHRTLLNGSMTFAIGLASRQVPLTNFDVKTGMWNVPPVMLLLKANADAATAIPLDKDALIPLNGTGRIFQTTKDGKVAFDKYFASVAQFNSVNNPPAPRVTKGTQAEGTTANGAATGTTATPTKAGNGDTIRVHAEAMIAVLDPKNQMPGTVPNVSDFDPRDLNAITTLMRIWDAIRNAPGFDVPRATEAPAKASK